MEENLRNTRRTFQVRILNGKLDNDGHEIKVIKMASN